MAGEFLQHLADRKGLDEIHPPCRQRQRHPWVRHLEYDELRAIDLKLAFAREAVHIAEKKLRTYLGDKFLPVLIPLIDDGADPGPALAPRRQQRLERIRNQYALGEGRLERAPYQREQGVDAETLDAGALEFDEGGHLRLTYQEGAGFGQTGDVHVLETIAEALARGNGGLEPDQCVFRVMPGIAPVRHQLRDNHMRNFSTPV